MLDCLVLKDKQELMGSLGNQDPQDLLDLLAQAMDLDLRYSV